MRVIQITDCHLFADKQKSVGDDVISFDTLSRVLKTAKLYKPDLVMITGDLSADESEASYQHFDALWKFTNLDVPLALLPGNHDNAILMKASFPDAFWDDGPIETSGWQLHGLHSQIVGSGKGSVCSIQLQQLQKAIDDNVTLNHFVAVHHHPIAMNSWMDDYNWINKDEFVKFVQSNCSIKIVIHGHVHTARDIPLGESRLLATPSTCWQFKHAREFAFEQEPPAFRLIDLDESGSFKTQVIDVI